METFVVRVWVPAAAEPCRDDTGLRGIVEHVSSQRSRPFTDAGELLGFVRECLQTERLTHPGPPP